MREENNLSDVYADKAPMVSDWGEVETRLHLNNENLIHRISSDPGRRVYAVGAVVYKVILVGRSVSQGARANNLRKEYSLINKCHDIHGVVKAIDLIEGEKYQALLLRKVDGVVLDEDPGSISLTRLLFGISVLIVRLARKGISHNDWRLSNLVLTRELSLVVLDFDQACDASFFKATLQGLFGVGSYKRGVKGSLMTVLKEWMLAQLPPSIKSWLWRIRHRSRIRLPTIPTGAPTELRDLERAWGIAQLSDASAPGKRLAYYEFEFGGVTFPGERPWRERWSVLRKIAIPKQSRVLELGCNLGLLSSHLVLEELARDALAVDRDRDIVAAAGLIASALGVTPTFEVVDFDGNDAWEERLLQFRPDIVYALNVFNWVTDKSRLLNFLSKMPEIVYEGHDAADVEVGRLVSIGFSDARVVAFTERQRPIIHGSNRLKDR